MSGRQARGFATPVALITLLLVGSLTLAMGALSASEPSVASNHVLAGQARAAAAAGMARALAALSEPLSLPRSFATSLNTAPFELVGPGSGFKVASAIDGAWSVFEKANQRTVSVAGFAAPVAGVRADLAPGRAVRMIEFVARRESLLNTLLLPAALAVPLGGALRGEIDARDAGGWCRRRATSVPPLAGTLADSAHAFAGSGTVWGPGNQTADEPGADRLEQGSLPAARDFLLANARFSPEELAALKQLALATGTAYTGTVSLNASTGFPPSGGVVFVEGDLEVDAAAADSVWSGWLVAAIDSAGAGGTVRFICAGACTTPRRLTLNGLVYAEDRVAVLTSTDTRTILVNGAVVAGSRGGSPATITPRTSQDFRVALRCQGDGGGAPGVRDAIVGTDTSIGRLDLAGRTGWYVKPGSYREIAGAP